MSMSTRSTPRSWFEEHGHQNASADSSRARAPHCYALQGPARKEPLLAAASGAVGAQSVPKGNVSDTHQAPAHQSQRHPLRQCRAAGSTYTFGAWLVLGPSRRISWKAPHTAGPAIRHTAAAPSRRERHPCEPLRSARRYIARCILASMRRTCTGPYLTHCSRGDSVKGTARMRLSKAGESTRMHCLQSVRPLVQSSLPGCGSPPSPWHLAPRASRRLSSALLLTPRALHACFTTREATQGFL
jgi:hypothetical protein